MKHTIALLLVLTACISCKVQGQKSKQKEVYLFTSFREPANEGLRFLYSYDGYKWDSIPGIFLKPQAGVQKIMRDPSIVQGPDGTFHLVWTCSWKSDPAFGYASSKDLIHWSEQRTVPIMAFDSTCVNVWAPEVFYDDVQKHFVIVWASTIPFKFEKGIEDEYNNHRLYYTTTTDFITFSHPQILYNPGYSSIDAIIVKRDKDDYVLVFKDNTRPERNIHVAFGKSALGEYTNPSPPFTGYLTEGPSAVKIGDEWLIYFDAYNKKTYDAVATKDFIKFTDVSDKVSVPQGHKHGTIIKVTEDILNKLKSVNNELK